MRVGWIGLGRMGRPMCENLVRKGFDIVVQNRSQAKVEELASLGAIAGGTFAEVAADVESIHTCLPTAESIDEVMLGPTGIMAGAHPGLVVVDHSTIHPDHARKLAAEAESRGISFLDAPVSGAGAIAERGELTIMVGGDQAAFDRVLDPLNAMGKTVRLMGPSGTGSLTKLINGLIMSTTLAVSFEGLALAAKTGVDTSALFEVIRTASGASRAWERNAPRVLSGEYGTDGAIRLLMKDEDIIHEVAAQAGIDLPVLEAARARWKQALDMGLGERDISEGVHVIEEEAGIRLSE